MTTKYRLQVLGGEGWSDVHPTGGAPYEYDTKQEAERMLMMCYPDQVKGFDGRITVRVKGVTQWVRLSNGEDYCLQAELEGIEYWLPNDETLTVRIKYGAMEQDTDFYEMDDFMHEDSDYRYVVHQGELMCKFEAEDKDRRGL